MADGYQRNRHGVKDGANCYRMIGGRRWEWYAEDASVFKGRGIRHRKAPDGAGTFIHPDDDVKAEAPLGY